MMTADTLDSVRIEVELIGGVAISDDVDLYIEQAWLPMTVLEDVGMVIEIRRGISMMERFVIESLLELNVLEAKELDEIASIPEELGLWFLSSLKQKGLARDLGSRRYEVVRGPCKAALAEGYVPTRRSERRDLLWFPETAEAVVIGQGSHVSKSLRAAEPAGNWPMPLTMQNANRGDVLTELLSGGRIRGAGAKSILEIDDTNSLVPESCPSYVCKAVTRSEDGRKSWMLSVVDAPRKGRSKRKTENVLPIPILEDVVNKWAAALSSLENAVRAHLRREFGIELMSGGGSSFSGKVFAGGAMLLKRRQLLDEVAGLRIRCAGEIEFIVALRLVPGDEEAKRMFEFDHAVRRCLSQEARKDGEMSLPRRALFERLWELGLFGALYELREAGDFSP